MAKKTTKKKATKLRGKRASPPVNYTEKPLHPWRLCPVGEHYREGSSVSEHLRKNSIVKAHPRRGTCAKNPSGKEQLYSEEITRISEKYFHDFMGRQLESLHDFGAAGDLYDHFIQGWTQYWNEVLKASDPLEPHLVKALIASESAFNTQADNGAKGKKQARGLMQVTNETLDFLQDEKGELSDYLININQNQITDPNLNICAGIRWLFRKKEMVEARLGHRISWREAIIEFKGYRKNPTGKGMKVFDAYFKELSSKDV